MQRAPMMAFRPALRSAGVRRQFATKPVRRSYQTAANGQPAAGTSHVVSGLAGGSVVLLGIYGYYHFSGAKTAVNSVRQMTQTAQDLKDKAVASTPSPKAMLGFIRSAALSYGSAFPGAAYIVNQTFDQIDQIAEKNGPEVEKIVKEVYADIQKAVQSGGDNVTDKVLAVIQEASNKVQQLSSQLSVSALQPYLEKNPQLKSAINDSLSQLNEFSGKYGPEAKKIAEDTINEIKNIADKGLTGESIMKASALAKEKLKQIQDLGAKAGSEAYSKAAEGARPYLDKAPDVKKYLEDSIGGLKEYVGDDGVKLINDTYADLEKAGKKGDTKALANIVKERIEQLQKLAKEKGPELASKATAAVPGLSSIPGMDKLLEAVPNLKDIHQLRELAQEKGGDFEKLLNKTYDEIKEILEKRAKEAKDLGGEAASDAKSKISK